MDLFFCISFFTVEPVASLHIYSVTSISLFIFFLLLSCIKKVLTDKEAYFSPSAKWNTVSSLVFDLCSCNFHAQCPCCVSSTCTCCVGLNMSCGQVHCWRIAILRQQKAIAPLTNKNLCSVFLLLRVHVHHNRHTLSFLNTQGCVAAFNLLS